MRGRPWVVAIAAALACAPAAADHETLGDRAYAAQAFRDALAEYRLALNVKPTSPALLAKTAAAALHVKEYELAARSYRALAVEDRSRADEAADGLERVARASLVENVPSALTSAIVGLQEIEPGRPVGRYARQVAIDAADGTDPGTAQVLLGYAVAAASDARTADSLLYLYGLVSARLGQCDEATAVFEGIIRRRREPAVLDDARGGLALCTLLTGQRLLKSGQTLAAEEWLRRAAAPGAPAEVARAAWVGLGDVRRAQGDISGALEAYQAALAGGATGDSISRLAQDKINELGRADTVPEGESR
jgi:tetratricopeptide (TPR) repeat protein